jgi:glutamine amidotransferase
MQVVIIDYGMSNLGSIRRALEECGGSPVVSDNPADLKDATHIVLPGVGAFTDGMINLEKAGWIEPIRTAALKDKVPFLGICLGMQLLSTKGYEMGESKGLDLIHGEVKLLEPHAGERIPHVGWNEVFPKIESPLFAQISQGTDFYFVHSYHFVPLEQGTILATTPYCGNFVSAVSHENVYGVQFHPEKSQRPGFQLLRNFLNL